jgi:DNA (cytosine-5)-methyltransferase 1
LAENSLRRIAKGVKKYVIDAKKPFIVTLNHQCKCKNSCNCGISDIAQPFKTVTASRDAHGIIIPTLVQTGYGERPGQEPRVPGLEKPLGTCVAGGVKHALVAALLIKQYGGNGAGSGISPSEPLHTVTTQDHHHLVTANLMRQFGSSNGADINEPMPTVMADGGGKTALVSAFLAKYYGDDDNHQAVDEPMHTIPTRDRFSLVTIDSIDYVIVDIKMRMLKPHELFLAQGFPDDYVISPEFKGKKLTQSAQVRMCGNSVCPTVAEALVRANYAPAKARKRA